MKTLVIHPKDRSTEFLTPIYKNIPNVTLLSGDDTTTKSDIIKMIDNHDRVIMMGHGSPYGLFNISFRHPSNRGHIIDVDMVEVLRKKNNSVFIWCNADQFVRKHQLNGFFSGMFISEVGEAWGCKVPNPNQRIVTESNDYFAHSLGLCIDQPQETMYNIITDVYGELSESNLVARYNHERLYLSV